MPTNGRRSKGPNDEDPQAWRHRELLDAINGLAQQICELAAPLQSADPQPSTSRANGAAVGSGDVDTSILTKLEDLVSAVEVAVDTVTVHAELIDGILARFGDERLAAASTHAEPRDVRACLARVSEACRQQEAACLHLRQLIRDIATGRVQSSRSPADGR